MKKQTLKLQQPYSDVPLYQIVEFETKFAEKISLTKILPK